MKKENYLDSRTPAERKRDSKIKSKTTTSSSFSGDVLRHDGFDWVKVVEVSSKDESRPKKN
jgi:hypothetical protein